MLFQVGHTMSVIVGIALRNTPVSQRTFIRLTYPLIAFLEFECLSAVQ